MPLGAAGLAAMCVHMPKEWEKQCVRPGVHCCWCVYVGVQIV